MVLKKWDAVGPLMKKDTGAATGHKDGALFDGSDL